MKILSMGKIIYDYSLPIDGFPLEGLQYNLKEKIECSGGGACNAAYLLSKWKEDVRLCAAVGGDDLGTRIRKSIEESGISISNVETIFEAKTPIEFILINKNTGNKTIFSIVESEPHVKKYELDFVPDIIYLDGYEYSASAINVINKNTNAIVVLDASEPVKNTVELLRYATYIIASQKFAEAYTKVTVDFNNPTTLLDLYKKFASKYPNNNLIITLKDHGAIYLDKDQIKVMPGLKVDNIKDATGAGDIFRAAFVAGLSRGYDLEKNIRIANIAAGLSLSKLGVKDSMPMFSDVASLYESKFGSIDNPTDVPAAVQQTIQATPDAAVQTPAEPVQPVAQPTEVAPVAETPAEETPAVVEQAPVAESPVAETTVVQEEQVAEQPVVEAIPAEEQQYVQIESEDASAEQVQ